MTRRRRILVYAQHLTGVGHYVRSRELADVLGAHHDVLLIQGGRPLPGRSGPPRYRAVELPALRRGRGGLEPLDGARSLSDVLGERVRVLRAVVSRAPTDVVIVEHYPFSKWELEDEIGALLGEARRGNPDLRVVCSVRDVLPQTRHEAVCAGAYERRVLSTLNGQFDALFVHSDPTFTRLEEHFPAAAAIERPVEHTGFVSERPQSAAGEDPSRPPGDFVVVSVGGGAGSAELVARLAAAWRRTPAAETLRMVIFGGLFWDGEDVARVREAVGDGPFLLRPFSDDFLRWMEASVLSISRGGYNTCTNVLETRSRALLVPNPRMSDQVFRVQRLVERGLADRLPPDETSLDAIAARIEAALEREPPRHDLDLQGAERTRELLEKLP